MANSDISVPSVDHRREPSLSTTRVRLTVKATTLKTPLQTLLLPSTIPFHSNSWFWTRRSRSLIRFVHPNMSLFHFNIPISTNGLFHNPISTNSSITSSNINRSIPNTQSLHTSITSTPTTIPITPTIAEIRRQRSKYAFERTFQVWGKSKLACSYVQANHASSAKLLRSPALSTGQAIGVSLLSLARCGGLWDYPRALKAGLLHPTATDPDQLGSPSRCILCHAHLDCKPMAHLVVDCTHPTVVFARVDTQLLQSINDTRVQIFDCTLHTTTTTTTITTTPASPSLSTATINSNPDPIGASAIWDSVNTHTPIDNYQYSLRTTPEFTPSFPSSPSGFPIFSFFQFSPHTRFEPPISVAHSEIPRQVQDTVEENPTASRTTTTDTHTAAISSTPTPTHISHIGSDDILTVLLGGSLPGTNTAGNTEACPGQQWLTAGEDNVWMDDIPEVTLEKCKKELKNFRFRDDTFLRILEDGKSTATYVHYEQRSKVVLHYHESLAHLKYGSIIGLITRRFWWPSMKKDIKDFISRCPQCQLNQSASGIHSPLPIRPVPPVALPFERWGIDFHGPMAETKSGNKYLITCIDYATRWVLAKLVKDMTESAVSAFLYELMMTYGAPFEIISDRGKSFLAEGIDLFERENKIRHLATTPYHPQTNGMVERMHSMLGHGLTTLVHGKRDRWDEYLPQVLLALRTRTHAVTGFSPFYLMFGIHPRLPTDETPPRNTLAPLDDIERMEENSEFIARNLEEVGQARSAANVRTKAQAEAMRKRSGFDENTPDYYFKVGDMVKMKHHDRLKLEFKWKGPYHVVDVRHPGTYWIMTPQGL
ncbi:hypothetical protein BASA50_001687 [Batrachochytrium salamandrivorans]|uniref:Integrase catalytic domain-containing protein n=1 Tax=Batrachochytrium salamandrivorans TaxID=1357716 RepID=A0ABQ8FNC6_9FUNG|nr:hypothetical protein BASA50_001687 [Batrachochytrium salamandrivorans]